MSQKIYQRNILNTLRKLVNMTWQKVYSDYGLKWEVILSQKGPSGKKLYSFRIGKGFRGVAYRDGLWLCLLSRCIPIMTLLISKPF
jgi:hypothetical protein